MSRLMCRCKGEWFGLALILVKLVIFDATCTVLYRKLGFERVSITTQKKNRNGFIDIIGDVYVAKRSSSGNVSRLILGVNNSFILAIRVILVI